MGAHKTITNQSTQTNYHLNLHISIPLGKMTLLLLERGPASIFNWTKSTLSKSNYKDYPQQASGGGGGGEVGGGG